MIQYAAIPAPFGSVGLVAGETGLRQVILTGRTPIQTARWLGEQVAEGKHERGLLISLQRQLHDYFDGKPVRFRVRVDLNSLTEFQRRVLDACSQVGYGQTITYGELARRIDRPQASRAVGAALGRNPVPLVIPCHRIVGSNGSLVGFSAEQGVKVKRWLLDLESASSVAPRTLRARTRGYSRT
jgi:methylated-DNA-[protein]-cysteine S-methyltransferase